MEAVTLHNEFIKNAKEIKRRINSLTDHQKALQKKAKQPKHSVQRNPHNFTFSMTPNVYQETSEDGTIHLFVTFDEEKSFLEISSKITTPYDQSGTKVYS